METFQSCKQEFVLEVTCNKNKENCTYLNVLMDDYQIRLELNYNNKGVCAIATPDNQLAIPTYR